MKQKFRPLKVIDFSLQLIIDLEYVFEQKIKVLEESVQMFKERGGSFPCLYETMRQEQVVELECLQKILYVNIRLKQEFCKHLKKDHDVCDGTKYCMNCDMTLTTK